MIGHGMRENAIRKPDHLVVFSLGHKASRFEPNIRMRPSPAFLLAPRSSGMVPGQHQHLAQ
jgi:hypothetical protein